MAATPKPVRRVIKRARIDAQRYLGVPVRAKIVRGEENRARMKIKSGKARSTVILNKQLFNQPVDLNELENVVRHEFTHVGYDAFMLNKSHLTLFGLSEGVAILSVFERYLQDGASIEKIKEHILFQLINNPPKDKNHYEGLLIAYSILSIYPNKKDRIAFIKRQIENNSRKLRLLKQNMLVNIDHFGEIL